MNCRSITLILVTPVVVKIKTLGFSGEKPWYWSNLETVWWIAFIKWDFPTRSEPGKNKWNGSIV